MLSVNIWKSWNRVHIVCVNREKTRIRVLKAEAKNHIEFVSEKSLSCCFVLSAFSSLNSHCSVDCLRNKYLHFLLALLCLYDLWCSFPQSGPSSVNSVLYLLAQSTVTNLVDDNIYWRNDFDEGALVPALCGKLIYFDRHHGWLQMNRKMNEMTPQTIMQMHASKAWTNDKWLI